MAINLEKYGLTPLSEQEIQQLPLTKRKEPGFIERVKGVFQRRGERIAEISDILAKKEQTLPESVFQTVGQAVGTAGELGFEALPGAIRKPITTGVQKIAETRPAQAIIGKVQEFAEEKPRLARGIEAGLEVASVVPAIKGIEKGVSLAKASQTQLANISSRTIRRTSSILSPQTKESAINTLAQGFRKSFVADSPAITNKLEGIAGGAKRFGGPATIDDLLKEVATEGYLPNIEGKLARFGGALDDLSDRRGVLANTIDDLATPVKTTVKSSQFKKSVENSLRSRVDIDFDKSFRQLESIFSSFENKFGKTWNAKTINEVRKIANKGSKAFAKEQFIKDTQYAIADAARNLLDELVPTARQINAEIGRLFRISEVLDTFNNRSISVPFWGEALGRYIGTAGGAAAGLQIAGPGGLVLAGVLANAGSRALAQMIRNFRFRPTIINPIVQELRKDKQLLQKLISEASSQDKIILKSLDDLIKRTKKGP